MGFGPSPDVEPLPPFGPPTERVAVDYLVVGSGLAGIYAALQAAAQGRVLVITKARLDVSNSAWAQGGIAAALDVEDAPASHADDTLRAGRGLCKRSAVEVLSREGPDRIRELVARRVPFDLDADGRLQLGLEGGHAHRRIVHANGLATGQAVVAALLPQLRAEPSVTIWEDSRVLGLLSDGDVCHGARIARTGGSVEVLASATILATGGWAGLFARTTNPPTTTGDGVALAYAAGAAVADMEFVQFHPTAFARGRPAFLLSEALRGEGAELWNARGERFMTRYDAAGELAPRDVVARAILAEMAADGRDHVDLRLDHVPDAAFRHFESVLGALRAQGVDPRRSPVPVAPAAHYCMGGVAVDLNGRTSLHRLWACGETACTGVHGANRLASNSLLECLVFGHRAAAAAAEAAPRLGAVPPPVALPALDAESRAGLGAGLLRHLGMLRDPHGLRGMQDDLRALPGSTERTIGDLMATGAAERQESRGGHYRSDFPQENPRLLGHFVARRGQTLRLERWD